MNIGVIARTGFLWTRQLVFLRWPDCRSAQTKGRNIRCRAPERISPQDYPDNPGFLGPGLRQYRRLRRPDIIPLARLYG